LVAKIQKNFEITRIHSESFDYSNIMSIFASD